MKYVERPDAAPESGITRVPIRPDSSLPLPQTVLVQCAVETLACAVRAGLDPGAVLAQAQLDPSSWDASGTLTVAEFSRLSNAISIPMRDEACGLMSRPMTDGTLEMLCRVAVSTSSFEECMRALAVGLTVTMPDFSVLVEEGPQTLSWVFVEKAPVTRNRQLLYEVVIFLISYSLLAWCVGRRPDVVSADLPFDAPDDLLGVRRLLPGLVRDRQPRAAIHFLHSQAGLPVQRKSGDVLPFLKRTPGNLLLAVLGQSPVSIRARGLMLQTFPHLPDAAEVAGRLAMSVRTLHRKLHGEGESFQGLKDQVRRDWAIEQLTRTTMPIKEIALTLGFADPPTFGRAFTRWTGRSPGEWRRVAGVKGV